MSRRFRYPLEALLTMREWRVADATRELIERQGAVSAQEAQVDALAAERDEIGRSWRAGCVAGTVLAPSVALSYSRYLASLAMHCEEEQGRLDRLQLERQEGMDSFARSLRERDAIKRDKDHARRRLTHASTTAAMHDIDERWVVRNDRIGHDNET